MKLLFVNASLTDGGSEKAMVLVANQMVQLGHDVLMLLVRDKKSITYVPNSRIELVQFCYSSTNKLGILVRRLKLIRAHVKEFEPDCIISFMWDINVMMLAATFGLNVRKIVSERAFPGSSERGLTSKRLQDFFYQFADTIVYQTPMARSYCPTALLDKAIVIPNIIDSPSVAPFSGVRTKRVVSVGRLTRQKNYPMLLKAFAEFTQKHDDYVLEIYGQGELESELRNLAVELAIGDKVSFEGYVDNVAERIRDAAMFVLASDFEGISNAMTEAMALGVPVVCTDCPVGGASLMIEDGTSGLLVPVGDCSELARAMAKIADDFKLSKCISVNAKEVVSKFSAEKIGDLWKGLVCGEV